MTKCLPIISEIPGFPPHPLLVQGCVVDSGRQVLALLDSCPDLRDCLVGGLDDEVEDMVNAAKTNVQFLGQLWYSCQHCSSIVSQTKPETKITIKNSLLTLIVWT